MAWMAAATTGRSLLGRLSSKLTVAAGTPAIGPKSASPDRAPPVIHWVACRGAYPNHTHAEFRQTHPSRVSAGRVCVPHVGHAIGAPILSNWVA